MTEPRMIYIQAVISEIMNFVKICKTCTAMFIAALLIIARIWTQPRYPSIDEWMKM